ncbi:hypothetical protein OAF83_00690 [Rubripirellula sp.]|jgi:ketosteroid isomerase-like protein|nr:nuclear transport factor 2 family protein [Rubripirellula sp.]MDB4749398.1 hypothetical protein [Rubripirellula sp.]
MSFALKKVSRHTLISTRLPIIAVIAALLLCSMPTAAKAEEKKSAESRSASEDFAELTELLRGSWRLENTAIRDDPEHGQTKGDQVVAYATITPNRAGTVLKWDVQFGSDGTSALVSVTPGTNQIRSFHAAPDGGHWELIISRAKKNKNNWKWRLANASFPTGEAITGNGTWKFSENGKLLTTQATLKLADGTTIELNNRMIGLSKSTDAEKLASASVRRFLRNFNTRNISGLADEFTEDSARVISLYQQPLEGREAIAASFEERFADEDGSDAGSLDAVVANARYISENVILADGTWQIVDAEGTTVRNGKWGNVLQVVDGQCKLLMESAHSEIANEEVSAEKSASRLPVPKALTAKDDPVVPLIEQSIMRYTNGMRTSNFDALAREFTPDGLQLVGNVEGPSRGYKEIAKAFSVGVGDGSPYEKTVLEAKVLGIRRIDDELVAAYGIWSAHTTDGELIDFGQWGNVFRESNGEVKMVMESAGSFE